MRLSGMSRVLCAVGTVATMLAVCVYGQESVLPQYYRHTFMFSVKKGINAQIVSQYFNVQFAQFKKAFPDKLSDYQVSTKLDMNWFKKPDYDVGGWMDFPSVVAMQEYFKWRRTNPYSFYTRNYIESMAQAQVGIPPDYEVDPDDQYRWIALFAARAGIDPNDMRGTVGGILRGHIDDLGYPAYLGNANTLGVDLGINKLLYKSRNYELALIMDFTSLYNMQNFTQMFVGHPLALNLRDQMANSGSFHYMFKAPQANGK